MEKTRLKLIVSYDGTDYCGWQRQNHGPLKSVQQTLEEALQTVFQQKISLFASGRTDAGVHARAQVCHVDVEKSAESLKGWDLPWALKSQLPPSVSVKKAWIAPHDFHATLSADRKTYRFWIYNNDRRSPFLNRYAQWIRRPIDLNHLKAQCQYLLGEQDFKSFQSVGTPVPHTIRTIFEADWRRRGPHLLEFRVNGSGFMKQMVRNIVGTQLTLEKKGEKPEKLKEIIALKDRTKAGAPAEPQGLYLWKVYYPAELDNKCREL